MLWSDALSVKPDFAAAVDECVRAVEGALKAPPDLLLAFASPHHVRRLAELPGVLERALKPKALLGCTGGGVIGRGREVETSPALSLIGALLPGVQVRALRVEEGEFPDPDASPRAWHEKFGAPAADGTGPHFMVLADPFSFNPEDLLAGLDYAYPRSRKVGGLASGGLQPGTHSLFLGREARASGAVVAALSGNVELDSIVAQGCRPVGPPFQITRCERNLLIALDGRPPLEVLEKLLEELPEEDQELVQNALFIGLLSGAHKGGEGEYLIRNLVGLDAKTGVIGVGARLRPGQTLQFHVRDGKASAQDLSARLEAYLKQDRPTSPRGAVLFSCVGRGKSLYRKENHDVDLFRKKLGPLPLGGFFCNGEIGPVEGSTYLHGYTSCFGIFRPAKPA